MAQQTAVEWFYQRILAKDIKQVFEQAKQMEKEQIIDAYVKGFDISAEGWNGEYGIKDFNNIKEEISAEQYYNETFGGQGSLDTTSSPNTQNK